MTQTALARGYAVNRDAATKAKLQRLLALYEPAISTRFICSPPGSAALAIGIASLARAF